MKFKTFPRTVEAIRITGGTMGPEGHWFVIDGKDQVVLSPTEFLKTYKPSGKESRAVVVALKAQLAAEEVAPAPATA